MPELISGGITLMVMGMSTVFLFLALLVVMTRLLSWLLSKLPEAKAAADNSQNSASSEQQNMLEVAVVAAAVTKAHGR
ncbi:OadG family protein [Reinekea thalattae]|uniref:Oxaloacetate decarboxylase gamma chain n=1 Tax=Reinekea thalattae TaxID=2593301 RepID=A0A5C8Z8P1_9GAMM|nr:OadG family protein [Reinekea thalattae]TXR54047.1 hypothetical protein FME95_05770 [Reinekea thalattae]